MALDRFGKLYGWGDGGFGCLGFGDNKRRAMPQPLHYFNDKDRKVIDVACGDQFTCVIAVVTEEVPIKSQQQTPVGGESPYTMRTESQPYLSKET